MDDNPAVSRPRLNGPQRTRRTVSSSSSCANFSPKPNLTT